MQRWIMKIINLDEEKVLEKAKQEFPNRYVEVGTTDLFLQDIETGKIQIDGIDHELYVSTHYVYEDHLINNNKTRYKVKLTTILLRKDPYDVVYDSYGKYYVAYESDDIHFLLYEEFQEFLKSLLHIQEEKSS